MQPDVAAAERVLELHELREVDRLSRDVSELESLLLELARRVRQIEAKWTQEPRKVGAAVGADLGFEFRTA